jgi:hypothetical protein
MGCGPAQHLVLLLEQPDPPAGFAQVRVLRGGRPGLDPSSTSAAFIQFVRHDSLIPKSAAICFRCDAYLAPGD